MTFMKTLSLIITYMAVNETPRPRAHPDESRKTNRRISHFLRGTVKIVKRSKTLSPWCAVVSAGSAVEDLLERSEDCESAAETGEEI